MRAQTIELMKQREKARKSALQIIGEQKYLLPHDISEKIGISVHSAATILSQNYEEWGLKQHRNSSGVAHGYVVINPLLVYTKIDEKAPGEIDMSKYKTYRLPAKSN